MSTNRRAGGLSRPYCRHIVAELYAGKFFAGGYMKAGWFSTWARRRLFGRRNIGLFAAVAGLSFAIGAAIPNRSEPADWARHKAGAAQLSVMSFNVLLGGKPADAALDAIAAADPDILCLQEMTPQLAKTFKARLGKRYPHRYFKPGPVTQGVGIASRYPLTDGQVLRLGLTYLPAVSATVRLKSGAVRLACVHLMPPLARFKKSVNVWKRYVRNETIRVGQVERLLAHVDAARLPAIIMGDMNEWPGQAAMAELAKAGFRDSCLGTGGNCGATWPARMPATPAAFRIDYILGRGVWFADAATLEAGGSDHYPVAARFRLEARPAVVPGQ